MPINILVVDDSSFFRHRLREILDQHPDLRVIATAQNGAEAVEKARELRPDVITMDYEMPVMDGVTAVRQIMAERPVPILMFSSLTCEGARITLDALAAGAVDFLPKNFSEISSDAEGLKQRLHERILAISRAGRSSRVGYTSTASSASRPAAGTPAAGTPAAGTPPLLRETPAAPASGSLRGRLRLLLLGASTGGPVALTEVLSHLPANFPLPVVLIQHMPDKFTRPFAERLNALSKIRVREAEDGDRLQAGTALLAPGGKQLMIDKRGVVRVLPADDRVNYKPSLDITFGSAASYCGNQTLAVIMTGMGSDGCEGARLIKAQGGHIWSQDEASSVIYGMPMAVARAGLSERVLSLKAIGPALVQEL